MKLSLSNETDWSTRDLRAIILRAARAEEMALHCARQGFRSLIVHIRYARNGQQRLGHAYYNSNRSTLFLPGRVPITEEGQLALRHAFAHTAIHEFAHNRGRKHRDMTGNPDYCWVGGWEKRVAWVDSLPLRFTPPAPKQRPGVEQKLDHARDMLARWASKAKRVQTGLRQWQRKVRYYERQQVMAAKQKEPL